MKRKELEDSWVVRVLKKYRQQVQAFVGRKESRLDGKVLNDKM